MSDLRPTERLATTRAAWSMTKRAIISVAVACLALGAGRARAVDDVVVADVAAAQAVPGNGNFVFNNNQNNQTPVDQWLFSRDQTDNKRSTWASLHARQLAELTRCCTLSEVQTKKLALAMTCDVERFFAEVDQMRERFPKADQKNMQEVQAAMSPMQMKAQTGDLCGPDSFFEKMLPSVLDGEQLTTYRAMLSERQRQRYLTAVDIGLLDVEDRLALDSRQHDAIRRLLVEQPLPRSVPTGWYMTYLTMYRLSQLPEGQLKPLFEESHWNRFNQDRMRFSGYGQYLKQIGVLGD